MEPHNAPLFRGSDHEDISSESESILDRLAKMPLLSAEDELVLVRKLKRERDNITMFERAEAGAYTQKARETYQKARVAAHQRYTDIATQLWNANIRLALQFAHRSKRMAFMDRFQWAALGLWRAINLYDPEIEVNGKPVRISTYAGYWIIQHMQRGADAGQSLIRLPESARKLARRLRETQQQYFENHGVELTLREVCDHIGVDYDRALPALNVSSGVLSLDQPYAAPDGGVGSEGRLVDLLLDEESDSQEQVIEDSARERVQQAVRDAVAQMEAYSVDHERRGTIYPFRRPAQALKLRFRIGEPYDETLPPYRSLEEVGKLLEPPVTRDRVNQLQRAALEWLRENCADLKNLNIDDEDEE